MLFYGYFLVAFINLDDFLRNVPIRHAKK